MAAEYDGTIDLVVANHTGCVMESREAIDRIKKQRPKVGSAATRGDAHAARTRDGLIGAIA